MKAAKRIAVIGGGSLGTLIALQLSNLEINVDIFESKSDLFRGASYLGEGKVHLGYTYGLSNRKTYKQLIESALSFADVIEDCINHSIDWKRLTSIPFTYHVGKDSLVDSKQFSIHGTNIVKTILEEGKTSSYLGIPGEEVAMFTQLSEDSFLTKERAVDLNELSKLLKKEIKERHNIMVHVNSTVRSIATTSLNKYKLYGSVALLDHEFDYVINCTWQNRHLLDKSFWKVLPNLNYRTKLYVSAQTNLKEVAETMILGKYGDLVVFNTGRLYASDYLTGLTSFANAVDPNFPEREELPKELVNKHWDLIKTRFFSTVPELDSITEIQSFERTVVAKGNLDIDQINSGLHDRSPYYVARKDNYISALGTKITTVPRLAKSIVDRIASDGLK